MSKTTGTFPGMAREALKVRTVTAWANTQSFNRHSQTLSTESAK